ncbi:MAG: GxxExxY protein [Chloroflexi bacterium]|nr:GxxExxY protein [Chloroflexota bacterium]
MSDVNTNDPLTGRILAAAVEVHRTLGPGFEETIYQRALAREFMVVDLDFSREVWMDIHYKGEIVGKKRVDFVVEAVLLEIKARSEILEQEYIQTLSYLRASGYRTGLLLNFGTPKIGIKRFVYG